MVGFNNGRSIQVLSSIITMHALIIRHTHKPNALMSSWGDLATIYIENSKSVVRPLLALPLHKNLHVVYKLRGVSLEGGFWKKSVRKSGARVGAMCYTSYHLVVCSTFVSYNESYGCKVRV